MIQVTTTFIGASATDVEASVATPLEQKINGVENMIYMKSTNANDGTLTLKVSFEVGSNLDMNNVLTQNRVSQGMPQMPQSVKNYGVSVKKALAFPLLVISIKSPNGTYDSSFLSNYTTININDAIARIQGVGQINLFGGSDYAMRVWLRPDVIGRLGITIPDIANAISQQNQLTPGRPDWRAARRSRHRVHLYRPHAGAPAQRGRVRRTSSSGPTRTAPRSASRTSPASSWGRCSTTPSAATTARRRRSSPCSRFRAPTRSTSPTGSRRRWPTCRQRFPRDMEYLVSLDTTLPVVEGITEIEHTLFEAVGARHHRRLRLPAELARHAHPAADRAGLARRRVHLLPAARLLDQRALAARPGPRHRHRRRRCDCRGRGGDASHRARDGAEGGDDQGDGGGVRARSSPSASSWRRCSCPSGFMGGITGAAVSAVRDHHRDLGAAVGRQRAHAQPGARGAAAQAGHRQEVAAHAVLQRLQQRVRLDDGPLRQLRRHPGSKDVPEPGLHRHPVLRDRRAGAADSRAASCPRRIRATCW